MTDEHKKAGDYQVGYGKPPAATKFKKGQSGNPSGRPRRQRERDKTPELTKSLLLKEADLKIKLVENGRPVTVSKFEAVIRSIFNSAIRGNARQQQALLSTFMKIDAESLAIYQRKIDELVSYKINVEMNREDAKKNGLPPPSFTPDPDDFEMDDKGNVYLKGPLFERDKPAFDRAREILKDFEDELDLIERELVKDPTDELLLEDRGRLIAWIKKLRDRVG